MVFSEAIFMTIYTLDTDCLICIGARHRDTQNLAGKPRLKGCECCKREETGPLFMFLWGLLLAGQNGFNWNPKGFRSKLWKSYKTHSALLLHCSSTLLFFALSKNFDCGQIIMRVKKVPLKAAAAGFGKSAKCETSRWNLVRFSSDGYTLSASHLPHLTAGVLALAVAKAGAWCLSPHSPPARHSGEIAFISICSCFPCCWDRRHWERAQQTWGR